MRCSAAAIVIALLPIGPIACATTRQIAQPPETSWNACAKRAVAGNRVTCDGAVLAEVLCLGQYRPNYEGACRGLVVNYADGAEAVLYRAPGFDVHSSEVQPILNKAGYFNWAIDPSIAPDGSTIWFRNRSLFGSQWQSYDVATGRLRDVDATDVWEAIQFKYGSQVLPLWKVEEGDRSPPGG